MNINTEQLKALLGSEAAARRFVDMFLENLPEQLSTLRKSLAAGNWETASITAHGLKSQFRYLGLTQEADIMQQLENDPENEQATAWLAMVNEE